MQFFLRMQEPAVHLCLGWASLAALAAAMPAELIKGVSYGPVPLKSVDGASALPQDDWMSDEAVPMWGPAGRGDLKVISSLGANAVRLYGNNPENGHANFLDEARREGLGVFPGMSDWPYYQRVPGSCLQATDYNCSSQVKPLYALNLRKGFLTANRTYHPALRVMNILNEPDLKMPPTATTGGPEGPIKMCRAIISAFDAMLEAEKEAGVTGPLINFTATFSYAICAPCTRFSGSPALGQMAQLDDAMRNPESYGYTPRNDITAAYKARWVHSFNTQNPATDLQHQFLDDYVAAFPRTPVYIGEYHRVGANQTEDLGMVLELAARNDLFLGIAFFQFQVAYWKTGSEMDFGMFALADDTVTSMHYFGKTYEVYCLEPVMDQAAGTPMPDAIASVYGGQGLDAATLCLPNPLGVPLDQDGYATIAALESWPRMASFARRAVEHLGATVVDDSGLESFARGHTAAAGSDFASMMAELGARPAWAEFDPAAKCVADRSATPATVGSAIGWTCSRATSFNCSEIPALCQRLTYTTADYVFSRYYEELGAGADPLQGCSFSGAAMLAARALYSQWTDCPECVVGGDATEHTPSTTAEAGASSSTSPGVGSASTTAGADEATSTTDPGSTGDMAMSSAPRPVLNVLLLTCSVLLLQVPSLSGAFC